MTDIRDKILDIIRDHDESTDEWRLNEKTADAILATIKASVPELVWHVSHTGYADDYHTVPTQFTTRWVDDEEYKLHFAGGFSFHGSPETAKAAAQKHHVAQLTGWMDK